MPQTKTAAPVLQHRDGQTKKFITCILPYISPICKAFANFTLTACGLGALCAVVALAQGGGAAALAGLACCLLGGWAAMPTASATRPTAPRMPSAGPMRNSLRIWTACRKPPPP